jgi:hypothetical protein
MFFLQSAHTTVVSPKRGTAGRVGQTCIEIRLAMPVRYIAEQTENDQGHESDDEDWEPRA